jgi:hypothetical protein
MRHQFYTTFQHCKELQKCRQIGGFAAYGAARIQAFPGANIQEMLSLYYK